MRKLIFIILTSVCFIACSKDSGGSRSSGPTNPPVLTAININEPADDILVGGTHNFSITTQPTSTVTASWASSNTAVAEITTAGMLTAKTPGTTEITATYGSLSDTKTFTVYNVQNYTSVVIYNYADDKINGYLAYLDSDDNYLNICDINIGKYINSDNPYVSIEYVIPNNVSFIYIFNDLFNNGRELLLGENHIVNNSIKPYSTNIIQLIGDSNNFFSYPLL